MDNNILQVEYAVIACMLQDETACMDGLSALIEDDFNTDFTQEAFRAIAELISSGSPVDETLIKAHVHDQEFSKKYNSFIKNVEIKHINFRDYFEALKQYSKVKQLKKILEDKYNTLKTDTSNPDKVIEDLFSDAARLITADKAMGCVTLEREFNNIYNIIENRIEKPSPFTTTGFRYIDENLRMEPSDYILIAARPGVGKAQPLDAIVLTPSGYKKMGEISIGENIIGEDGKAHKILGIFPQGKMPIYNIMMSDGTCTECTKDHLWLTKTHNEQKGKNIFSVKTTEKIMETLKIDGNRNNHEIPLCSQVEFLEQQVSIHPYILGALLGDGCLNKITPMIYNTEESVIEKIRKMLPLTLTLINKYDNLSYSIKGEKNKNLLTDELRKYGLAGTHSHTKFIPAAYIYNSVQNRVELLRGLFDTGGYVKNGTNRVEFTSVSKTMAEQVLFIARSLGAIGNIKEKKTTYFYRGEKKSGKLAYRVLMWFPIGIIPVSSDKNVSKWNDKFAYMYRKHIKEITYIGEKECQCILIDSDSHLYITNDFIVTHNTAFLLHLVNETVEMEQDVLIFSIEMPKSQLAERYLSMRSGIPYWKIRSGRGFAEKDYSLLEKTKEKVSRFKKHVLVNDNSRLTISSLTAIAKKEFIKNPNIKAIFIDYLQLMQTSDDLNVETTKISRGLKQLAKDLNIPVIALSQLSRKLESRPIEERKPILSDLRDSGSLEQDADAVCFLYRPYMYTKKEEDKDTCTLIVGKQRNGPTFEHDMGFDTTVQQFREMP